MATGRRRRQSSGSFGCLIDSDPIPFSALAACWELEGLARAVVQSTVPAVASTCCLSEGKNQHLID
jgi:hypothetical protein